MSQYYFRCREKLWYAEKVREESRAFDPTVLQKRRTLQLYKQDKEMGKQDMLIQYPLEWESLLITSWSHETS